MADTEYNGWTNYETWLVNTWMDNEESSQDYWRETAEDIYRQCTGGLSAYAKFTGRESFTTAERAAHDLSARMKDEIEEDAPAESGLYADLLNAALSSVNWQELAVHLIGTIDTDAIDAESQDDDEE